MTAADRPHHEVSVPVPRDPDEYAPSDHYRKRRKYRSDPEIKDWIVEEVIEEGHCNSQHEPNRYKFHKTVWSEGTHHWDVIVAVRDVAFLSADADHVIVTAYCQCHDSSLPDCND